MIDKLVKKIKETTDRCWTGSDAFLCAGIYKEDSI